MTYNVFDGTLNLAQPIGAGMVMCLSKGADLHMAQLMPLPLYLSLQ